MTMAEKLTAIAENEQKVFDVGKQTEHDAFWDAYQDNGARQYYGFAFGNLGWTKEFFKPKYDMKPTYAYMMFNGSKISVDLVEHLKRLGVTLDFSESTSISNMFANTAFTRVGEIYAPNVTALTSTFDNSTELQTIDKLILKADGTNTFSNTFRYCNALKNITIEGVIGNNLDIHWSPLTHDSLMSIINHLQTKSSGSFVLTLGTTNLGKLSDAEKAIATEKGWTLA